MSCKLFNKFFKTVNYILLNNFIRVKDVKGFVNCPSLFDFNVCRCSILNCRFTKIHGPPSLRLPKAISKFEVLLVKIFSIKQKLN